MSNLKTLKELYFEKAKNVIEYGVSYSFGTDFWDYVKKLYFEKRGLPMCGSCSSSKLEGIKYFINEAQKLNG